MFYGSENFGVGAGLSIAPPSHHSARYMGDQTFHTPNFGDEEFEIPPIALPTDGSHPHAHSHQTHQTHQTHPNHQSNLPYSTMMGHGGEQQHYAQMYLPEHMTTHSGVTYGGSPPTYTTLSSPHAQQPMSAQHHAHHVTQTRSLGRSSSTTSPPRNTENTSEDSNDSGQNNQVGGGGKRPSPEPVAPPTATKKPKPQKKKKKRDPNEPQKPVSAYALFFRDTQAAIKGQNPNASFGEVSKIVASMWDALEADHKNVYKKKTEAAKKEYLKALAAYRASLVSKGAPTDSPDGSGMYPPGFNASLQAQQQSSPQHTQHYAQNYYAGQAGQKKSSGGGTPQPQQSPQHHHNHLIDTQYRQQQHHQPQAYLPQMGEGGMSGGMLPPQGLSHEAQSQAHGRGGQMCIRNGCSNGSISSHEWDEEYCSSDCVVTHCRDVFTNWVSTNQSPSGGYHAGTVNKFAGPGGGGVGPDGLSYAT